MTTEDFKNALIERHGIKIYEKLQVSSVALAGVGGLGSNVAVALARVGIGKILLTDFDKVDVTNLNRQHYFIDNIGKYKVDALENIIRKINPIIKIEKKCVSINEENATDIFNDYSIVSECFDKAENKAMLINTLLTKTEDKIVVSASGMAGFGSSNDIVTKKINNRLYICGDGASDMKDIGLMSPRVGICAYHQANMILRLLLGEKEI